MPQSFTESKCVGFRKNDEGRRYPQPQWLVRHGWHAEDLGRILAYPSAFQRGQSHRSGHVVPRPRRAFAAVLVLIYILMVGWFNSFLTPLIVMVVILFSLIGVLPAHGLLRAFFTATSMIGFMAGAGIVVHNSIILVDFIEMRLAEGHPLAEAVVEAGMIPNDDVVKDFDLEKLTGTNEAACDLDSRTLHK